MLPVIIQGGYMMFPLMALSLLSLTVIFERYMTYKKSELDTRTLIKEVLTFLKIGEAAKAIQLCSNTPGPISALLLIGLQRYAKLNEQKRPVEIIDEQVTKAMNEYAPQVVEVLDNRLSYLSMIATTAPLLGMTGTVTGMISAFNSIAGAGQMDAQVVASGIAEALITTAAGLIIAIPAVVAYSIYTRRVERFVLQMEEATAQVAECISTSDSGVSAS